MKNKIQLNKAFAELRKKGYFARQNFTCCQSCGWAELTDEESKKAVFYHRQDAEDLKKTGVVYLAWSGSGQDIVNTLNKYGLATKWEGTDNRRIVVKVLEVTEQGQQFPYIN